MDNEIIIIAFDQEKDAAKALEALKESKNRSIFGLGNAVVVTKDSAGLLAVYQQWRLPDTPGDPDSQLSRLFAEAIFGGFPQIKKSQLVAAGLDEDFLIEVMEALQPGGSALVIYNPRSQLVDRRQLLNILLDYGGKLHYTIFHSQVLETIEEMVK